MCTITGGCDERGGGEGLIDPQEVAALVARYGVPERRRFALEFGEEEFEYWRKKSARRRGEVVLVIRRPKGRVLLHTKGFYPPGAYRLPSGGVRWGEEVLSAVHREAREETGLDVQVERFLGLIEYKFRHAGQVLPFASYVFLLQGLKGQLTPQDSDEEITAFREVPPEELEEVAWELEALAGKWRDWGRFRALAHHLVSETL
jgi:ADP-ribose pyrophosphatase YjhB (NUDIX family)